MTGADVVTEARRWVGTPWRHQARLRCVGVDCGGLVVGVAHALGLPLQDYPAAYGRLPDGVSLRRFMEANFTRLTGPEVGAVPLMRWTKHPQHVGIVDAAGDGWSLIHAWAALRRVVEHPMDATWGAKVVVDERGACFYRLPGVTV